MLSTFTDYHIISRDLQKSLDRKASEASIKADVKYFQDHIGEVKTVDEFVGNRRLFTFAMKAYGLDDMAYAKSFMKKVLLGEPDQNGRVLADRLQDPRYQAFAAAFNFRSLGTDPAAIGKSDDPDMQSMIESARLNQESSTHKRMAYGTETDNQVQYFYNMLPFLKTTKDVTSDYKILSVVRTAVGLPEAPYSDDADANAAGLDGKFDVATLRDPEQARELVERYLAARGEGQKAIIDPYFRPTGIFAGSDADVAQRTAYFRAKMHGVTSAKDIANDPVLADIVRTTLDLPAETARMSPDGQAAAIAKKLDVASLRDPRRLSQFLDRFRIAATESRSAIVKAYLQQTLETDAGDENQGVRLALYFRRKAATITSAYGFLADPALAEVVRTTLGLPPEAAKSSLDSQAKLIARRIDLAGLKDPAKLDQFIKRFTIRWDAKNDAAPTPALSLLNSAGSGLDSDVLLRLQNIRLGTV
ncbi:DUF1217 domain-containing protein [Methylobacterium longum]|uniref:DUF1217 domain-containing protein n=1 Tax=Methylobacterium longum TaxID=767694 RepID=A0ABT8AQK1_9HYPH|nr:DUF1217 domain-containing protein [Methylobacterium longum]MDN3571649.1 DUF1217 domain-containing protein [Methylobacterium longum]GJE11687.1 hypothetical protein FOHLNKBM_2731 [Methylobacterium longum]